jgi:hypothetical protein
MRSSQLPSARLMAGEVDMAPWLPQCWMVTPIQAPATPGGNREWGNSNHRVKSTTKQAQRTTIRRAGGATESCLFFGEKQMLA